MQSRINLEFEYAWGNGTQSEVATVTQYIRHTSNLTWFVIDVHSGHQITTDYIDYTSQSEALYALYKYMAFFVTDFDNGVYND